MSTLKVEKIQHPNSASVALTLDTSGYLALQAGSASTPAIQGPSDPNTGIFFPAADTIAFAEGGAEALRIDSSGRVGIGTSNPSALFTAALPSVTSGTIARFSSPSYDDVYISAGASATSCGIGTISSSSFNLYVNSSSRMLIDSSGRLGIGTNATSPTQQLHVRTDQAAYTWTRIDNQSSSASAYAGLQIGAYGNTWGLAIGSTAANSNSLTFLLDAGGGNSEKMRLDTSGRLLVGTSSTSSSALLQVQGNSSSSTGDAIIQLRVGKNNAGILNGNSLGSIQFSNTESTVSAVIEAIADANWNTTNDYPSRLVFSTTADGASSPTERMRIRNNGKILFGQQVFDNGLLNIGNYTNGDKYGVEMRPSADNATPFAFDNAAGTLVGSISTTSSSTAFNTSSDYRLKENVVAVTDGITRLEQLKPSRFNFIADPDKTVDGFIAHEVQTIVPEAITGEKDAVDDDGNPVYQGIDQSKLVPLLTAALQEAVAKIESLEARLTAAGI